MTGPKPLPKRALHLVQSRASSFKCEYPLICAVLYVQYEQFCDNKELCLENVSNLLDYTFQLIILYIMD